MSNNKRKVIIVGYDNLHEFFVNQFTDWDCQVVNSSIDELWNNSSSGYLSNESSLIIFQDVLYDEVIEGKSEDEVRAEFAEAVATMAAAGLLTIIVSYEPSLREPIMTEVQRTPANESYRAQYGTHVPFEFVNVETVVVSIEESIEYYENGEEAAQQFQTENSTVAKNIEVDSNASSHYAFNRDGKVITVTSNKGGSGKSTVALLLATTLSQTSKRAYENAIARGEPNPPEPLKVCIVDLDTYDGQLGFVLNQATPTSLNIALASNQPRDEELVWNNLVYSERMGFHTLLAPVRGQTARFTDAYFYNQVIDLLKNMFDVIILDTSVQHYDEIIKMVALPQADVVLLVTTLDIKSVKGLARWVNVAASAREEGGHGLDMNRVGIVVNSSVHNVGIGLEELTVAAMDAKLLESIPLDTTAMLTAGNANRLEEIIYSHPTISNAYHNLAKKVAPILGNPPMDSVFEDGDDDSDAVINPTRKSPSGSGASGRSTTPQKKKRWFAR